MSQYEYKFSLHFAGISYAGKFGITSLAVFTNTCHLFCVIVILGVNHILQACLCAFYESQCQ